MIRKLPFIFLAVVVAVYFTAQGFCVSAASPVFYDGTVTWAIGRRDTSEVEDFNYSTLEESLPRTGSLATISPNLCGVPGNQSTTKFSHIPSFISINSPELAANGGYVYVGFCFAYCTMDPWGSNVNFSYSGITQSLSRAGSLAYSQGNNAITLTRDRNNLTTKNTNSYYDIDPSNMAVNIPDIYPQGFTLPDGANFAKQAYFGYNLTGYVQNQYTFFNYGDTASYWQRTFFYSCRITIPSGNQPDAYNTVWIDLTNSLTAQFQSQATTLLFDIEGTPISKSGYECSCVYLCPVFCYATSFDSYSVVEEYLDMIVSQLSGFESPPQSVLESYAALGSEAREAAHAAASAMAQNYPTYDPSAMDISNVIDSTAKAQFKSVVSFLGHQKILPIIGVVFTLVLIGYVFFGKK